MAGTFVFRFTIALVAGLAFVTGVSTAQARTARVAPCQAMQYKEFDFWIGNWDVYDAKGAIQGHNLVTRDFAGCVLTEHWSSPGQTGSSFSNYDSRTDRWYQNWVDSLGNMLMLRGRMQNGSMIMTGLRKTREGRMALERGIWKPLPGHRVQQIWDYSLDGGKTWTLRFEGFYKERTKR